MIAQRKGGTTARMLTVEVNAPFGQKNVLLEGISPKASIKEVLAMARSELNLNAGIEWDARDEGSSRLLDPETPVAEIARDSAPQVRLTMQPNAGLG